MESTSTKLWQVRFNLTRCYDTGVPLPEPVSIDSDIRILRRGDQGDCWAAVAIEAQNDGERRTKQEAAEGTIAEIANIYALLSGFPMHFEHSGSNSLRSRDDFGKPSPITGKIKIEVSYPKDRLEEYQHQLMDKWQRTKVLWSKVHARLRERNGQFLRVAVFYHYQSCLPPDIPLEEAFVNAAIGLEALFNESPQDIAYKLALRGALVLSFSGETENCFQTLKELYKLRNNIVHGTGETIEYAQHLKIKKLLAKSIKACLPLGLERNKPEVIELIDKALIEPKAREELRTEIDKQSSALFG
jgi:hypothetical protein